MENSIDSVGTAHTSGERVRAFSIFETGKETTRYLLDRIGLRLR